MAAAGTTSLSLASTLGLDGGPGTVLQVGTGGTQEMVRVARVAVAAGATSPFPGTATLSAGAALRYAHSQGEPVVAFYYEQQNPLGSSTSRMDQYWDLTQAGQIARGHAPMPMAGDNVRVVFLRNPPLGQVQSLAVAYPWSDALDGADVTGLLVDNDEGWVRFPLGYFLPPDSVVHVTYTGGFQQVPDDVQEAVIYYAASSLALGVNFLGASTSHSGDASVTFTRSAGPDASGFPYVQEAERLLRPYRVTALS
jgi:hypothetical protein